jgi:hypothetical protein
MRARYRPTSANAAKQSPASRAAEEAIFWHWMSVVRSGSPQALVDWDIASGKIRLQQAFPSAYCLAELLTGEVKYPGLRYDGYGDGVGTDLRAFVSARMRADWAAHREELLAFWISGEVSYDLVNSKPWLQYRGAPGTRPWAWWHLESHLPRERGESEAAYLTRHDLWLPGERELLEARNAEAKVVRLKR